MIYGCVKSELDGTELKAEFPAFNLPEEFSYIDFMPPVRDQGETSTCVCQTLVSCLDWKKGVEEGENRKVHGYSIDELYNQRLDKYADGMQIKTALSYLRNHGLGGEKIEKYFMVGNSETLRRALYANGPCAAGLMVRSGSSQFWKGPQNMGGHCICIVGYTKDGFIIRNSWGSGWGQKGYTILPYKDFGEIFECWTFI